MHDRQRARAGERRLSRDRFVENAAEREDVGAAIEILAARLFGRHVGNGPYNDASICDLRLAGVAQVCCLAACASRCVRVVVRGSVEGSDACNRRLIVVKLGEAEVEDFCVAAFGDEDVRGFYVAMNDVLLVCRVERVGNFDPERDEHFKCDRAMRNELFECGALQEFHRNESLAILLADVVNRTDVRMIERGGGLRFALEAGERARIVADIFGEEFQSDVAVEAIVFGFVHNAHAAGAQAFENAVVRQGLADKFVGAGHERDMLDGGGCGGQ